MLKQLVCVHNIKRIHRKLEGVDIALDEADIVTRGITAAERLRLDDCFACRVDANYPSGSNPAGKVERQCPRAATDIEQVLTRQ